MTISSAQYQRNIENTENVAIKAIINGVVWSVPLDPTNTDYQEILKQVEEGTLTIKDAE
tara:strand:- start:1224 stop:1400 length:177 start_codon:yes stop_codon:yes gene_type:complete